MPKAYDFKLKVILHTFSESNKYRLTKPDYANDSSHVKNTCEVYQTGQHKMRIQFGKCANDACYENHTEC